MAFGAFPSAARKRFVLFWSAALILSLLWAMGGFTPFYHLVYAIVPGTKYFRAPSAMLYVVAFCIAVLAAVGTERALAGLVSRKYLIGWLVAGLAIALLATSGGLTNLAASIAGPERIDVVRENGPALTMGAWRSFAFVVLTCAVIFGVTAKRVPL